MKNGKSNHGKTSKGKGNAGNQRQTGFGTEGARLRSLPRRESDVKAEALGYPGVLYRRMLKLGLPGWFFMLLYFFRRRPTVDTSEAL